MKIALNVRLAMLTLVVLVFSVGTVWAVVANFSPIETPSLVSATTSSSATTFTLANAIAANDVKVCNQGSQMAYWACGNSSVLATLPGSGSTSTEIDANKCGVYHKGGGATTCAAITPTSTTSVAFTAGEGF